MVMRYNGQTIHMFEKSSQTQPIFDSKLENQNKDVDTC